MMSEAVEVGGVDDAYYDEKESFKRNLKGVKALVESGITKVPHIYIKPPHERPTIKTITQQLSNSTISPHYHHLNNHDDDDRGQHMHEIPVIDLAHLDVDVDEAAAHADIVKSIGEACEKWGFFQVINHGVPSSVMSNMIHVSHQFFDLPTEEKMELYSNDTFKKVRFGTSYNVSRDEVLEWRDYLRCPARPLSDCIHLWPAKPSAFREVAAEYSKEIAALATRLCDAISESLGLQPKSLFGEKTMQQQILMPNHYPPCPNPDLTLGLSAHSDSGTITILLQDEVGGLEVFNDGRWIAVKPLPDAFIVNLADQTQVLTNGKYKSVEHRAIVNSEREHISISTFFQPSLDANICPAPKLLKKGQVPVYRESLFGDYLANFFSGRLNRKSYVESLKVDD